MLIGLLTCTSSLVPVAVILQPLKILEIFCVAWIALSDYFENHLHYVTKSTDDYNNRNTNGDLVRASAAILWKCRCGLPPV